LLVCRLIGPEELLRGVRHAGDEPRTAASMLAGDSTFGAVGSDLPNLARRTSEHRDDRVEHRAHALNRRPPLACRLVVIRVLARRVQDRDADLAISVD